MDRKPLTDPENRRFHQQMNIPGIDISGQEKIKNANVAVIGAGGTGAGVLQYLSSVGVGKMTIIDNGLVDEQSMQRQTLYGVSDMGKLKTIISRQRLQTLYPACEYEIINLYLDKSNIDRILTPFDFIVDSSNDWQTNYIINDSCIRLNKTWIFSNVSGLTARVSVFNYLKGPSLRCLSEKIEYNKEQAISISYGFAAIITSIEVIKLITNQPNILTGNLLSFNCFQLTSEFLPVKRNEMNFNKK